MRVTRCELIGKDMPLLELTIRGPLAWGSGAADGQFNTLLTQGMEEYLSEAKGMLVKWLINRLGQWSTKEEQLKRPLLTMAVKMLDWSSAEVLLKHGFLERSAADLVVSALPQNSGNEAAV